MTIENLNKYGLKSWKENDFIQENLTIPGGFYGWIEGEFVLEKETEKAIFVSFLVSFDGTYESINKKAWIPKSAILNEEEFLQIKLKKQESFLKREKMIKILQEHKIKGVTFKTKTTTLLQKMKENNLTID